MYRELLQFVIALSVLIAAILVRAYLSTPIFIVLLCAISTAFLLTQTKNILLLMIFAYQKFAPKLLRSACLFQPSCSEYMKQCIIKYGVFRGVKKGFKRIKRCHPPNGGLDEP
ncbi:membrane protein insertion efficiency factor YidD [uncultured Ruminococcus sp.]|uniref:membrane protein insertion efficiency factor YidD n=1 Tax=uncultured Ruminococcus sp. TaxID=165186 RepID=UPI00344BBE6A